MTRRPSFQFYPYDYRANANLMRCSHEEKGVWVDTMCLMHYSATEYGVLRWPLKEIGQAVHCKVSVLVSLVKKGVMKGADPGEDCEAFTYTPRSGRVDGPPVTLIQPQPGPLWYSSRMVKDEYVRQQRGKGTRFEDNPDPMPPEDCSPNPSPMSSPNPSPKPPFGDGSSSSSSSSSSSVDSSLRWNPENPIQGERILGLQVDPVLLVLPCQKGKRYHVTQGKLDQWGKAYSELDPMAEARKMLLWLEENPTRQKTFTSMGRFVTGWLNNSQERLSQKKGKAAPAMEQATSDYLQQNRAFFEGAADVRA